MNTTYNFDELKTQINKSVKEHNGYGSWDGTMYNTTTILAIIFTSVATLIPSENYIWVKSLSGAGAILIAIDRSVNWGARWIYHRQMRHEYLIILGKISFYENLPSIFTEEERKLFFKEIFTDLFALRRKEISMPGVKNNP